MATADHLCHTLCCLSVQKHLFALPKQGRPAMIPLARLVLPFRAGGLWCQHSPSRTISIFLQQYHRERDLTRGELGNSPSSAEESMKLMGIYST
jgi:hypothetical protein